MKLIITTLFFLISFANCYADTLDYYHVYHNDLKIAEYNSHNNNDSSIVLKISKDSIQQGDQLVIKYYKDFLLIGTSESIYIGNKEDKRMIDSKVNGNNYTFDLTEIKTMSYKVNTNILNFNYELSDNKRINIKNCLFLLELTE